MSVSEERNTLRKRFRKQALITVDDTLYSVESLKPDAANKRLFRVHPEAVERLNQTMQRHINGNSQIYVTSIYKDVPREEVIVKFWNGLIQRPEFKALPVTLQKLELEQAKKLGPTSRFTIEKLYDGFVNHIDEEAKVKNQHLDEYREAMKWFAEYIANTILEAMKKFPDETGEVIKSFYERKKALDNLNKDKSGGDPLFINVGRQIGPVLANEIYFKEAERIVKEPTKQVYYTMYIRCQAKGNTFIPDEIEPIAEVPHSNMWLPEKNRVVQGDSRSWQFLLKNMSDVITKLPKLVDPNFVGWSDQERKNEVIKNYMVEFQGKYLFDSFDATDYDASTDPDNLRLGIELLYRVLENVGLQPNKVVPMQLCVRHYLNDATLTPWGAFERDSTPSGHNFTGPVGTLVNMLRAYVQTARLFGLDFKRFNQLLYSYRDKDIPLFMAVGDDAVQLRGLDSSPETVAAENDSDGFKQGDVTKLVLSGVYLHFLQFAYYQDDHISFYGYYPVCRVMEHCLFQEKADQYTAETVVAQAVVQNLNNARFNPLQDYAIDFLMEGDKKYRLGSEIGVLKLFELAAKGRSVAETLGREWDPMYQGMSWDKFGETISGTVKKIESRRGKFSNSSQGN